jgi:hypothetical protein
MTNHLLNPGDTKFNRQQVEKITNSHLHDLVVARQAWPLVTFEQQVARGLGCELYKDRSQLVVTILGDSHKCKGN